jgi:hypothetical protein
VSTLSILANGVTPPRLGRFFVVSVFFFFCGVDFTPHFAPWVLCVLEMDLVFLVCFFGTRARRVNSRYSECRKRRVCVYTCRLKTITFGHLYQKRGTLSSRSSVPSRATWLSSSMCCRYRQLARPRSFPSRARRVEPPVIVCTCALWFLKGGPLSEPVNNDHYLV